MPEIKYKEIEYVIESVSYFCIKGSAWCPESPSEKVNVELRKSDGTVVASTAADREVEDLANEPKSKNRQNRKNGFVFYGLMHDVLRIMFIFENASHEEVLTIEQLELPEQIANYGFCIFHPDDFLFKFSMELEGMENCVPAYICGGAHIASEVLSLCNEFLGENEKPYDILDFASGYGRVTRGFDKSAFNITASDIHEDAMKYIESEIGVETYLSSTVPEKFNPDKHFDVIFAFSFFSHMPHKTFGRWLSTLYKHVKPGGLLVFTTHGRINMAQSEIHVKKGYGFYSISEQKDLDSGDYGITISELPYVSKMLQKHIGQSPVLFREGASIAGGQQDLYVIKKVEYHSLYKKTKFLRRLKISAYKFRIVKILWKPFKAMKYRNKNKNAHAESADA